MSTEELPSWTSIADWYDELLVAGSGPHETAVECLRALLPDPNGRAIVDVACGQGIASRLLASLGAHVIAIDSAPTMVANAVRHGTPTGHEIDYRLDDAQALATIETNSVDGATCQLALMDIPDLDAALHAVARVLRPGGWFAFVIGHPVFLTPGTEHTQRSDGLPAAVVSDYFNEHFWRSTNPEGVRRAGNYHRMMSTYLNALRAAGFTIEEAREPVANDLLAQQQPLYSHVPIFFAARVRLLP